MSLRIQFLGPPRIRCDGAPIDLAGYRPLALLAYLIVTQKSHTRQQLIDLLFDGPDDPRAALRWTLSKIRKAIGDEYLLTDREEITFNFESDYWVDVSVFEAGELELYQGDFLEGLYLRDALRVEDWLGFERERLRGLYQAGLEAQLEMSRREGDASGVVNTAQQLLKLDNLREDWHVALMDAYARLGKRATALEQYEQCRQALRAEWTVDPSPETTALAESIRRGKVGLQATPVEGADSPLPEALEIPPATPVGAPRIADRPVRFRPVIPLIAVISLVSMTLLLSVGIVALINQASQDQVGQPGLEASANPSESLPQIFSGKTVWILGRFEDTQARLFQESMMPLEERTGIEVKFLTADDMYDIYLANLLESGDLTDIVMFEQPGWLKTLSEQGKIVNLSTFLDDDYLSEKYPEAFLELARVDGQTMGVWYNAYLKSLVWYPKQAFEAKGYEVPETWEELMALSDRIVADGGVPWCIGMESEDATGWVGTDWVEDILLRTAPPETYDSWVKHDLPFDSPEIRRVFEIMGQIWLNDAYVYGGTSNISKEDFFDSPLHLFDNPPGCYLHRQASFALSFFPADARFGQDYDFFYLPPINPEFGNPVLGAGTILAMVNDRPEVREVMRYLTTAESTQALVKNGGFLTPHRDTPIEWFPTTADLRFAQIVLSASTYRFDGSDLMPEQVGLGSFYRGVTDWVEGADLDTVLQEIDNSWPQK
jgi:alpha-glucoside transport system substrate-binding protein